MNRWQSSKKQKKKQGNRKSVHKVQIKVIKPLLQALHSILHTRNPDDSSMILTKCGTHLICKKEGTS